MEFDAFVLQQLLHGQTYILIFMADDPLSFIDDCRLAAHATIELTHFKPDITTANDCKMLRKLILLEPVFRADVLHVCHPRDWRYSPPKTGVHVVSGLVDDNRSRVLLSSKGRAGNNEKQD